jgi:hypothetical protein
VSTSKSIAGIEFNPPKLPIFKNGCSDGLIEGYPGSISFSKSASLDLLLDLPNCETCLLVGLSIAYLDFGGAILIPPPGPIIGLSSSSLSSFNYY